LSFNKEATYLLNLNRINAWGWDKIYSSN